MDQLISSLHVSIVRISTLISEHSCRSGELVLRNIKTPNSAIGWNSQEVKYWYYQTPSLELYRVSALSFLFFVVVFFFVLS